MINSSAQDEKVVIEAVDSDAMKPGPKRVTRKFLFQRASHLIALGFGSGLAPIAPGTIGTLWAWVMFLIIDVWANDLFWAVTLPLAFLLGIWACAKTGRDLGVSDHGAMVWDEVVAFWFILWIVPATWGWQLIAFILFRFFDAVKPPPVGWADRRFKGGFGVMFDDLVAAFMTLLVMALLFAPWFSRIFGE
jgi:phosphatidylglycerophosphatase A